MIEIIWTVMVVSIYLVTLDNVIMRNAPEDIGLEDEEDDTKLVVVMTTMITFPMVLVLFGIKVTLALELASLVSLVLTEVMNSEDL